MFLVFMRIWRGRLLGRKHQKPLGRVYGEVEMAQEIHAEQSFESGKASAVVNRYRHGTDLGISDFDRVDSRDLSVHRPADAGKQAGRDRRKRQVIC